VSALRFELSYAIFIGALVTPVILYFGGFA
jgi:hypothetical protein